MRISYSVAALALFVTVEAFAQHGTENSKKTFAAPLPQPAKGCPWTKKTNRRIQFNCNGCNGCAFQAEVGLTLPDNDRVKALTALICEEPNNPLFYKARGIAWGLDGKADCAIKDFSESLRLRHNQSDVYILRGVVWLSKNEYVRAAEDFDLAIRFDPKSACAYFLRATAMNAKWSATRSQKLKALDDAMEKMGTATAAEKIAKMSLDKGQADAATLQKAADTSKEAADQKNADLAREILNLALANRAVTAAITCGNKASYNERQAIVILVNDAVSTAKFRAKKADEVSGIAITTANTATKELAGLKTAFDKAQEVSTKADDLVAKATKDLQNGIRELTDATNDYKEAACLDSTLMKCANSGQNAAVKQRGLILEKVPGS